MRSYSRRAVLGGIGIGALAAGTSPPASAGPLVGANEVDQTAWLGEIIARKPPQGNLLVFRFADEIYALNEPIAWFPGPASPKEAQKFQRVDVPKYFVTDFASVPRIFWSVLPRDGKYLYPAIIHDYLYWTQDRPREEADEILRVGMGEFGVDPVTINAIYWSVRAGGGSSWDENAKAKSKGERRILKELPKDPLETWAKWKVNPSAF